MNSPENHWQRSVPLNGAEDSSSKPLRDAVICFTSVPYEKRIEWVGYAKEMGATTRADLTGDVTHLVVGDYKTPKYQYVAKERPDVMPMTMLWIEAVRELWINDKEIDVEALEKEHKLPTLSSLRFSMTGCDDPTERFEIAEKVRANGGVYEGDLTKQITHLISFRTEGAKYKAARLWKLQVVSIEWLNDSLERGMILDETLYDPVLPQEQRGVGAWDKTKPGRTSLGKRSREDSVASMDGGKRKLRRTASTKLSSGNDSLWADISGSSMVPQVMRSGVWESIDDQAPIKDNAAQRKEPAQASSNVLVPSPTVTGPFSGCRFYLEGFAAKKCEVLGNHIIPNGANISSTLESFLESSGQVPPVRLFKIIPHNTLESKGSTPPQSESKVEVVTEWWLERCLHSKKFIEPSDHVVGRPFPKFPIERFQDMTISSAGFTGIDLLHVQKAVALIGAKYSEDLTPQSTVLITKSIFGLRKDKADHATQWNIPLLNATWLWDSISAGEKLPFQQYRFRKAKRQSGFMPSEDPSNQKKLGRSKSEATRPVDTTAFAPDDPPAVRAEVESQNLPEMADDSTCSIDPCLKTEPLSEISHNPSPSRTVSTAPAPSDHPAPRPPPEDLTLNISNLLAKTKKTVPAPNEQPEGRKRGTNRILGRVTSNTSTGSASLSRASSVDSTATHGNPVEWPSNSHFTGSAKTTSAQYIAERNHIERFMDAGNDRNLEKDVDSQPPSTQLEYDDPESREYQERVLARMKGEKVEGRKAPVKERSATLGDVTEQTRVSRGRRARVSGYR